MFSCSGEKNPPTIQIVFVTVPYVVANVTLPSHRGYGGGGSHAVGDLLRAMALGHLRELAPTASRCYVSELTPCLLLLSVLNLRAVFFE